MAKPVRRNFAHLTTTEREQFANAVRQIDLLAYSDGVSYWDKQDQIHQGTHNHGGNSFIPWHRELCNRFENLLQQVDPDVALHYWDWTQDPRAASDGAGGTVNLCTDATMGTANGTVAGTLAPLHNGDVLAGSRDDTGDPADPPRVIRRNCDQGAPGVPADATIIHGADALAQLQQWTTFRTDLESAHNTAHLFFGFCTNIWHAHSSFEDPFVFLLHSNVDRLFALWQAEPGQEWRLDPDQVYGDQKDTSDSEGILHNLQPWDGTVEFGALIPPWDGSAPGEIEVKNCRHPSVVTPPCYDTLPVTVSRVAPAPGDPIRFLDVYAGEETARGLRLRVRACEQVVCNATVGGDPAFTLLAPSVTTPEPSAFEAYDLLVWVLFAPGAAGSTATGQLQVDVPETGDSFTVPIEANVIPKPTVAASLVLDRSGSMDEPSGVVSATRMEILKSAAPLFLHLLDDDDGVGVVRFDTDAAPAPPADTVDVAGGQIAGTGRNDALQAISAHATNPLGLTAIGDGLEAAATQLAAASGFDHSATVVFTDGHETAAKYIADVVDLVTSRVFAIGLGTADQLNPGALDDLVDGSGGYLLLTGNPGPDDQILLKKYFAQILAGVTNAAIVVDPDGFVPLDGEAVVPYDLTAADSRSDVIVLGPAADIIAVTLEAPSGDTITGTSGAEHVLTREYQTLRLALPSPAFSGPSAGTWRAHLKVNKRRLRTRLRELEKRKDERALIRLRAHGVPFTLTVQARSSLRLAVAVAQPSRRPGSTATLTATLTESGILLGSSARVFADVTAPDGTPSTVPLAELEPGVHHGTLATPSSGVYRVLVRADGASLRGERFTRQELRTLPVWRRGDEPVAPPDGREGLDLCGLVTCLLDDEGLLKLARQRGIDVERLRKCVERHCRGSGER
jgi:hypothetical protein